MDASSLQFYEAADEVFDKLREIAEAPEPLDDATALQIQALALIGRLKSLNRAANTATRLQKDATTESRQEMDQAHLGLQNLLYEKRHLEREIEKCRQFASIYQDVPLHSVDEFKQLAPEELRTPEVLANDHQLMLNRLSFELTERQRLDQKKRELIKQKEDLLRQSKAKAVTTDSVKTQIETLIKTATEAQKKVNDLVLPIQNAQSSS
ncbi:Fms-interacting protein-domain-containing protein [Coprinopsis sp. MPI-PUGE-AT-0042]|nr:Fms-interacting protein-domain-containing protein [Coprinopsis sp. MPI-PUGE-AT-0042]